MKYTLEDIYIIAGKENKTTTLSLREGSSSYNSYGTIITVEFIYTQRERENLDELILQTPFKTKGHVRAKYLGSEFHPTQIEQLENEGIYSDDILKILWAQDHFIENTFHFTENRYLTKLQVEIKSFSKDVFRATYHLKNYLLEKGNIFSPHGEIEYLALKTYLDPAKLTDAEKDQIYQNGEMDPEIEWKILGLKFEANEISAKEKERYEELIRRRGEEIISKLKRELNSAGTSLKTLVSSDLNKFKWIFSKLFFFEEKTFNPASKYPIYLDLDRFLHIYMRHAQDFEVGGENYKNKDDFQWNLEDVIHVISSIIEGIDEEYQMFRDQNLDQRFSRFGPVSIYFEGDYYILHIEADGRISTIHKNKKIAHDKQK